MRRVIDVQVGTHIAFFGTKAHVSVRDSRSPVVSFLLQPVDGVADGHLMFPVEDESVGDDSNIHTHVREVPQCVAGSGYFWHGGKHVFMDDGIPMEL